MKAIWKSVTDLFGGIIVFFKDALNLILPPKFWHWQTFLLLTIVLWLLSTIIGEVDSNKKEEINFISSLAWLSLTIAMGWRTNQKPFIFKEISLSPWVTGGLISFLLYQNLANNTKYIAVVSWPIISVSIAAIILVLSSSEATTTAKTSQLSKPSFVTLILVNCLISCWLGLYFLIQDIVQQYPTMGADDLSGSTFVYRLKTPSINDNGGTKILNLMEERLNNDLGTQRLGLSVPKMKLRLESLKDEVAKEISVKENDLWELKTGILSKQSGYELDLQLFWQGFTAKNESYYLSRSCKIGEKVTRRNSGSTAPILVGKVECSAVKKNDFKQESEQKSIEKI
ncbi:DUF5357 family protein [Okeania sp.]|uniref:DUF5357 family protein n=1 Tax=Okeania sp. TaxID=3100323 RepID=UPI002B4B55E4|nr:DUF5357 family protein [Okeania sp.]MEB3341546.1 DUF5357 family protein [Okeania sp.]